MSGALITLAEAVELLATDLEAMRVVAESGFEWNTEAELIAEYERVRLIVRARRAQRRHPEQSRLDGRVRPSGRRCA